MFRSGQGSDVIMRYRASINVITTCGPTNFELVKSMGASAAFHYREADYGEAIHAHTQGSMYHAFDCISDLRDRSRLICNLPCWSIWLRITNDCIRPRSSEYIPLDSTPLGPTPLGLAEQAL
jgi:hypothetical protein